MAAEINALLSGLALLLTALTAYAMMKLYHRLKYALDAYWALVIAFIVFSLQRFITFIIDMGFVKAVPLLSDPYTALKPLGVLLYIVGMLLVLYALAKIKKADDEEYAASTEANERIRTFVSGRLLKEKKLSVNRKRAR